MNGAEAPVGSPWWYAAARDFGFPVLVAGAVAFWYARQDDRHALERAAFLETVSKLADVTRETAGVVRERCTRLAVQP